MREAVDAAPLTAEEAVKLGLVDGCAYRDQAAESFGERKRVSMTDYIREREAKPRRRPLVAAVRQMVRAEEEGDPQQSRGAEQAPVRLQPSIADRPPLQLRDQGPRFRRSR